MAIKMLSGQWEALQQENVKLRDNTRKRFYSELGIKPAKNVSEIDIPPGGRNSIMQSLIKETINGREGDGDMKAVAELAGTLLGQFTTGFMSFGGLNEAFDMSNLSPKALRNIFLTEEGTTYEYSELD